MSKFWDQLVKYEVWRSEAGKQVLTERLRQRWVNLEPSMDWLGRAKESVTSLYCNDKHIFCGQGSGLVRVYSVTSGEWIRDLVPIDASSSEPVDSRGLGRSDTLVAGGKKLIVSVAWDVFVTVWSRDGDMDWLTSYECMSDDCREEPFHCEQCNNPLKEPVCPCNPEETLYAGKCIAHIYEIKVTPEGKIVILANFHDAYTSMLIMQKTGDIWTVNGTDIDENCGSGFLNELSLGCHGNPYVLCESGCLKDYHLCLGSTEKNFVDWPHHPHNSEGFEFDERETSGISGLSLEPPFLILVNDNPDYDISVALRVFHIDTHKVLKDFGNSRGRCTNLMTNEFVVVQLQETRSREQQDYILIYDKKMLLDSEKTAEDVKIQMIEIEHDTLISINTTSLIFAEQRSWSSTGRNLGVLNFWVERDLREEGNEERA